MHRHVRTHARISISAFALVAFRKIILQCNFRLFFKHFPLKESYFRFWLSNGTHAYVCVFRSVCLFDNGVRVRVRVRSLRCDFTI